MVMYVPLVLLFLVASFGLGFILNMLTKKMPWTSTVVAVVLAGYFLINIESVVNKLLIAVPILIGGVAATLTIRTLQARGFKMFG